MIRRLRAAIARAFPRSDESWKPSPMVTKGIVREAVENKNDPAQIDLVDEIS